MQVEKLSQKGQGLMSNSQKKQTKKLFWILRQICYVLTNHLSDCYDDDGDLPAAVEVRKGVWRKDMYGNEEEGVSSG